MGVGTQKHANTNMSPFVFYRFIGFWLFPGTQQRAEFYRFQHHTQLCWVWGSYFLRSSLERRSPRRKTFDQKPPPSPLPWDKCVPRILRFKSLSWAGPGRARGACISGHPRITKSHKIHENHTISLNFSDFHKKSWILVKITKKWKSALGAAPRSNTA